MAYTNIDDPSIYFNTVLFTGTASGNKAVTGVGFQPDWVWTKNRVDAYGHNLYDSVRGTGKYLQSNGNSAESSSATSMVSFDSDGFTVGTGDNVQYSSNNGVSWNWKAGGSASSNTDGTITSSVSANTTAGFSIVSYTGNGTQGATVGHGLAIKPSWILVKRRDSTSDWLNYHSSLGATKSIFLNATHASGTYNYWNSTEPTSSVFEIFSSTSAAINASGGTYIAYCFAEKKGYSKFGSYTGNGNADGAFVYTGFKPAFVLIKVTSTTNDWEIHDNKRGSSNVINSILQPNLSDAESTSGREIDFLSNGFKLRNGNSQNNLSGGTFIYMAFAESPFVNSNGVPNNAK
jgi:hypothetical protein